MLNTSRCLSALPALAAACISHAQVSIQTPVANQIFQRETVTSGHIPVKGKADASLAGKRIEARFGDREWAFLTTVSATGAFAGQLSVPVGQSTLYIRLEDTPAVSASVSPVGLGDVFVIAGQSNADGRGTEHTRLSPENPYAGTQFRDGAWRPGSDPSDHAGKHGSPWPIMLNALIPEQHVPMAFIQTAVGSTVVRQWRAGGNMFSRMRQIVRRATAETMHVKGVLYYQGENDVTHYNKLSVLGDYEQYRRHLGTMVSDMHSLLNCPVLVGQITSLPGLRDRNDAVRGAQQDVWEQSKWALPGAVTYDIRPTDGVHYRDRANMEAFAERWIHAVRNAFYSEKPVALPKLNSISRVSATQLRLTFSRPIAVSSWDKTGGEKARGFRVTAGDRAMADADILTTEVHGSAVLVTWRQPLPESASLWYGSGTDGQGKPSLRDAVTGQPVRMVFGMAIPPGQPRQ